MSDDPHALKLYTDGNCYKNPGGAGAIACVAKFPESWNRDDEVIFKEGFYRDIFRIGDYTSTKLAHKPPRAR